MENASQALIIAAGILLGILILSLGSYLYYIFGDYVSNTQAKIAENTLVQFNDQFLKYDKLTNLTIQDIVTVKNNALENNYKYSDYNVNIRAATNNKFVDVFKGNNKKLILDKTDEEMLLEELQANGQTQKYTCAVEINTQTGRVYKVYFYPVN